jgi:type VI secretion system protein ImpL
MTRKTKTWLGSIALFVLVLIIAWVLSAVLALHGSDVWVFRGGLALLGLIAAGTILWFFLREPGAPAKGGPAEVAREDIDATIAAARTRLSASRVAGKAPLRTLPVVLVLGADGSAKTTTVLQCGLEPELLAGAVSQEDAVAPTPGVNLWFSEQTIILEAGGPVVADPARWSRVIDHIHPARMRAAITGRAQAPRAAVVCVSCETLLAAGSPDAAAAAARGLRSRITEASKALGIRLPVYVIFTKADRIPHFADYVQNVSNDEARQVVGATLSTDTANNSRGVYADQQTERLQQAFQRLFHSLAERRLQLLARESAAERKPGAYEFPRELRKLAPQATQFLVELCRPSQLQAGAFLRGFYFVGVRAVIVNDAVPANVAQLPPARARSGIAATSIFQVDQLTPAPQSASYTPVSRKLPQWVFLGHLFRDVILRDRTAMGLTTGGVRVNGVRRALLAGVVVLALAAIASLSISYSGNRALQRDTGDAARSIAQLAPSGAALPTLDALRRLDSLRMQLQTLRDYERDGAPVRLRFGLYTGAALLPTARRMYFAAFDTLMFHETRAALDSALRGLPDTPGKRDDYGASYDLLKAYLITTSNPDKATAEFLTPVLMTRWLGARELDADRLALAKRQFDFYSDALPIANPYRIDADTTVVAHTRSFLLNFAGEERIYQNMIAEASKTNPSVRFNRQFPGSSAFLVVGHDVPGAYTKGGWDFMQGAYKDVERFFKGESWVMGDQQGGAVDRTKLLASLRTRYEAEYLRQWRAYLQSASVVRYANPKDAARKLAVLSSNQSPLLAMLALASRNSAVDTTDIGPALQPVRAVVPSDSTGKYVGPSNAAYMTALATLQASLDQAANASRDAVAAALAQTASNLTAATVEARKIGQTFRVAGSAGVGRTVQALLEAPISHADPLVHNFTSNALNAKGAAFCADFQRLAAKFPFTARASAHAAPDEMGSIFAQESGSLWAFYHQDLQSALAWDGTRFAAKADASPPLAPAFVAFFNRAASVSRALFANDATVPHLTVTVKPILPPTLTSITFTIDGKRTVFTPASPAQPLTWTSTTGGSAELTAQLAGTDVPVASFHGPWAFVQLFNGADRWTTSGGLDRATWIVRTDGRAITQQNGAQLTVAADIDFGGAPPVLEKGYFAGLQCVRQVAR